MPRSNRLLSGGWREARERRAGLPGKTDRKVYGTRFVGKLPANFDYNIEAAGQTGSVGDDDIRAMASHAALGYTLTNFKKKPRLVVEYNYASGDETPGDGVQQTFDQLYPTGHDKQGLADQVGWKNIHDLRTGIEYKATSKLTVTGFYHSWWLASPRDALYNAAGAAIVKVAERYRRPSRRPGSRRSDDLRAERDDVDRRGLRQYLPRNISQERNTRQAISLSLCDVYLFILKLEV